jgi:D-Tyr-tRNAtyr deacylase
MATCGAASGRRLMQQPGPTKHAPFTNILWNASAPQACVAKLVRFQETMQVELVNHGPVTILLDSSKVF